MLRPSAYLVDEGRVSECYEEVAGLTAGSGRSAYVVRKSGKAVMMVDGRRFREHDGVRVRSLIFTAGGKLLYVARKGRKYQLVEDGRALGAYDQIKIVTSPDRRQWGYLGRRRTAVDVVVGGRLRAVRPYAADLVISSRGDWAYLARDRSGSRDYIVHGEEIVPLHVVMEKSLVLSDDGRHWGCIAGDRTSREVRYVIDGRPGRRFDFRELIARIAAGPERDREHWNRQLRSWVKAELKLVLVR